MSTKVLGLAWGRGSSMAGRRPRPLLSALRYLVILVALAFFLFPIFWIVTTAFKFPGEYLSNPPVWLPSKPTMIHFGEVMKIKGWPALRNSVAIAGLSTVCSLFIGGLGAYALARFNTGGNHLSFWLLSQRMMPPVVLIIPLFLVLRTLGLIDSHLGMILLYTLFNLPYVVWMMRGYFSDVPLEVEESALVDGASRLGVLWRITLPLALPGLIATGTFAFIFSWTEFLFALILTRSNAFTIPVTIAGFYGTQGSLWGQAAALSVVAIVPMFVVGMLVQRHFVRGLTLGAVRG